MNHLKKIIKWIVNILTGVLLLILILVIYGKCTMTFTSNQYPSYFGYTLFEVASGSMKPTLDVNDVIIVKIENDNLKKDDIIAFFNDKSIITHRIVYMDNDIITVKGDNNNTIDSPINRNQVIGKVTKILPKLGIWKKIFTEPKILVIVFITLLAFDFALSYSETQTDIKIDLDDNNKVKNNKEEKVKVKEEVKEEIKEVKKEKDIIEKDKLLELTRKIDLSEINEMLHDEKLKLSDSEIKSLKNEIRKISFNDDYIPELKKKEKKFLNYTLRLDLKSIQKKINNNVK